LCYCFWSNVHGQSPIYTSSGTWTCPAGVTSVTVELGEEEEVVPSSTKGYAGGGGGGGAYSIRNTVAVTVEQHTRSLLVLVV
jgi:hypothetical protein